MSNLMRSYKGFRRPIELSDASVSPTMRAEYLAATITAALDRPTAEQTPIAQLLEHYFAADYALRDLDATALADKSSDLSREARSELEALLPIDAQTEFRQLFASPIFLFVTMCATADRIVFHHVGNQTSVATGHATFTIQSGDAFDINSAGGMVIDSKLDSVRPRTP